MKMLLRLIRRQHLVVLLKQELLLALMLLQELLVLLLVMVLCERGETRAEKGRARENHYPAQQTSSP